jgi:hypothetical protein
MKCNQVLVFLFAEVKTLNLKFYGFGTFSTFFYCWYNEVMNVYEFLNLSVEITKVWVLIRQWY